MRLASESIGKLAAALAKAQVELVNPRKSLTGIIYDPSSSGQGRSFRYASLSTGLDIARKVLGQHELAVIQTTHLDESCSLVLLTTTLAHGSGEWLSTSWPVCRLDQLTNPQLMGAALTYARRYSLFALVGLAGEDDLDAPELGSIDLAEAAGEISPAELSPSVQGLGAAEQEAPGDPVSVPIGSGQELPALSSLSGPPLNPKRICERGGQRRTRPEARPAMGEPGSALQPDEALALITRIESEEALLRWALEILPVRNRVSEDERRRLDAAFFRRAKELGADPELLPGHSALPLSAAVGPVISPEPRIDDDTQASV